MINPNVVDRLVALALANSRGTTWYCVACGLRRFVGIPLPAPTNCRNCGGTSFAKQPPTRR